MKFGDFLQKAFGAEMNKEVDFNDFNIDSNPPAPPVPPTQQTETDNSSTVEHKQTVVYQQPTNIIVDDPAERVKQQQAEIERLKNLNSALLNKMPVEQEKLTMEDMIYRAVIGVQR